MTPKEEALELLNAYYNLSERDLNLTYHQSIECALIAVDVVILALKLIEDKDLVETTKEHWQEVKTELENLK